MSQLNTTIQSRIIQLSNNATEGSGNCVLYVMSRDQRVNDNDALRAAQLHAQKTSLPLVVGFVLFPGSSTRAREHVAFMMAGLYDVITTLASKNIPLLYKIAGATKGVKQLIAELAPAAVYFDFSPLREPRNCQESVAKSTGCPVYVVDAHNIVPVWCASNKQEYAARTIRPKILDQLDKYMSETVEVASQDESSIRGVTADDFIAELAKLTYRKAGISLQFLAGESAARNVLTDFIDHRLSGYAKQRNNPSINGLSNLSPYLHFGQLSSRSAVHAVLNAVAARPDLQNDADAFIEEVVVRKELSDNYCYYNLAYDSLLGAPAWAKKTLAKHAKDPREHVYARDQFEQAQTHDTAWNAAQIELTTTGKIHGYMRMYWAKKILEWSGSPDDALQTLIFLNDFYSLDGGDPNGHTGIMWSVAGVHDRPWQERPIYGTIRSMVYSGLKRKFNLQQYIDKYTK